MMKRFFLFCTLVSFGFLSTGCEEAKKTGSNAAPATKEAAGDMAKATGVSDVMGKATEALSSVEGGSAMLKNVTDSFGNLNDALKGITDADSATAALPKLSDITDKFGRIVGHV